MMNDSGRYYAFHFYNDGKFLGEVSESSRMDAIRLRDEYASMGFEVKGDPQRKDGLLELSNGPLFDTPMDYNDLTVIN
jgi:hypothetical protein